VSRSEPNPAFLVYAEAELADARSMTFEQFGMYTQLRAIAWREHGLPADHSEIARRLGLTPKAFAKHSAIVLESFQAQAGRLVLPAYESQRAAQVEKREKAQASANARWKPDANALRTDRKPDANALRRQSHVVAVAGAAVGVDADTSKSEKRNGRIASLFEEPALNHPELERLFAKVREPDVWKKAILEMKELGTTDEQVFQAAREFLDNGAATNTIPLLKVFEGYVKRVMEKDPFLGVA
jgi:uncharacterized protein YdaU (DUF1376 family)